MGFFVLCLVGLNDSPPRLRGFSSHFHSCVLLAQEEIAICNPDSRSYIVMDQAVIRRVEQFYAQAVINGDVEGMEYWAAVLRSLRRAPPEQGPPKHHDDHHDDPDSSCTKKL